MIEVLEFFGDLAHMISPKLTIPTFCLKITLVSGLDIFPAGEILYSNNNNSSNNNNIPLQNYVHIGGYNLKAT